MTVSEYENIVKLCGLRILENSMTACYGKIPICSMYPNYWPDKCLIIRESNIEVYCSEKYNLEFVTEPDQAQKLIMNQIRKIKESLAELKKQNIETDFKI